MTPNAGSLEQEALARRITRREFGALVGAAAATAASGLAAQAPAPAAAPARPMIKATTFNHLAMGVTDVQRTADWYQKYFGMPVRFAQGPSGARIGLLRVGDSPEQFLELIPVAAGEKPGFRHMGFGVQSFDRAAIEQVLAARNIQGEWRVRQSPEGDVEGVVVRDPDGLQIQIQDARYTAGGGRFGDQWSQPWTMAPRGAAPQVQVRCINHATFGSASKERAWDFYMELFGLRMMSWDYRPGQPSRILGFVADSPRQFVAPGQGQNIGINHYCLGVESFDRARVVKMLTDLGATPRPAGADRKACCGAGFNYSPNETALVSDPDGISVQITDMNYCAGTGELGIIPAL